MLIDKISNKKRVPFSKSLLSSGCMALLATVALSSAGSVQANGACVVNIAPPDGCSSVGENVKDIASALGTDFTGDCVKHDVCYRTIGTRQSVCDAEFQNNMRKSCISGPSGAISANIGAVILSCGLPSGLTSSGIARTAPGASGIQDDWVSSLRDTVVRPVKAVAKLVESVGTELIEGVVSASNSIAAEYHRVDDNAKKFRDKTVSSLVDGLETIEGVIDSIPGSTYVFAVTGRPSEILNCVYEETLAFARNPDILNQINPGSKLYSAGLYPSCIVASNVMANGPRIAAEADRATGAVSIYEGRQKNSIEEAVRLALDSNCTMTAADSGLFRSATNEAIYNATISRIFKERLNRPATSQEYSNVRRHAESDPNNWQFNVINALESGSGSSISNLQMAASYDEIRPSALDLDLRNALLSDYSAIEGVAAKRIIGQRAARIVAAMQ